MNPPEGLMRACRIVCVAAMLVPVYPQDTARAGNQIFRIPPGWTRTDNGPSTILSPGAEPRNMVVLMLNGRALRADFRATFDQDLQAMRGTQRVVSGGEVQSGRTPQ